MSAIDLLPPGTECEGPSEKPFGSRDRRSTRRVSIIGAVGLLVLGWSALAADAAYAQTQPNPPQNKTAPPQGSGQGMMGGGQMMGGGGGTMGMGSQQEAAKDRGIIGIVPALSADAVGAPARLVVRSIAPYSPAYFAGIQSGDQIVAVDGQSLEGKGLNDVVTAVRGEVGTAVKLSLSRQGQSREVSLTRVEPVPEHDGHRMSGRGEMGGGGMN